MTKIIELYKKEETKRGRPIEFVKFVPTCEETELTDKLFYAPCDYDNVALIGEGVYFDTIVAWNNGGADSKFLYLGHWNGGFVEEDE